MALNYVTLVFTEQDAGDDAATGSVSIAPTSAVVAAGLTVVSQIPVIRSFGSGTVSVSLVACDNTGTTPAAGFWAYNITLPGVPPQLYLVNYANGATQQFSNLTPVIAETTYGPAGGSGGFTNPMTAAGDMIDGGTAGAAQRLPVGSAGQVLTVSGGAPSWQTPSPALPLTTLGDTLYENGTPAPARLPGNTSATKNFLTQTGTGSASAAPAWGPIAAGDLPVATTSAQGAVILDGAAGDIQPLGTQAAGAIGKAADAGHIHPYQPWQFTPEAYGAKGDGQQALVTTVAGSAVINTTPLAAPSAPTLSNSGSGGSLTGGTYQVKITYVNQWGETVASSSTSVAISGAEPLTISSPAGSGSAAGWYAYVTQAGGSSYTRQQAAGSPTPIGVALALTVNPTSSGASPPGSDTSAAQVFTSTAVDGGKNIMICGGLGSPGTPWTDTIASVQSPTQATLSSNGSGQGGNVSQAGCAMVFSSDDRTAIDACVQAAAAYAVASGNYFCQVIFRNRIYGLGTGLFQSTAPNGSSNPATVAYNAQVRIPVPAAVVSGQTPKLEVQFLGPGDNAHACFWVSQLPNLNGTTLVSYSIGPGSPDATYGQQSVIGGPQGGVNYNGSNAFANVKAVIKGIQVVQPGWSNSIGIDLANIGGMRLNGSSQAYAPATNTGGGVNPSSGWGVSSFFQGKIGAGLRTPLGGDNDDSIIESFATEGLTTGVLTQGEHLQIGRLVTINCYFALRAAASGMGLHSLTIAYWSCEGCLGGVFQVTGGSPCQVNIVFDGENQGPTYDISDSGNKLLGVFHWYDGFRSPAVPTVTGAANLKIINDMAGAGHMASPPSVPSSGPSNTAAVVYRDAWVVVHTGSGVTVSAITVDGTATGLTMAASSSLAVRVAAGKTIALTYAGGTPTWDWWLD